MKVGGVTEQNMEVRLPVATKAKLMRQMLVQKERGFVQLGDPGEWRTPVAKTSLSAMGKV